MTSTTLARLNNGVEVPRVGLGVFQSARGEETRSAVAEALRAGYRHVGTARIYANEQDVGAAIRGVGKTGLATGILLKAIQNGYKGLFVKAQDLFDEMYASLADHATRKLIDRLARVDVIAIDEMGYLNLRPEQSNIFFKLMEERYNRKSTIITTNLDYDDWYNFLGNKHMVGALLDRLRHHCHTIRIDGQSLRAPTPT
jgi:DNA replication protein DnaC